MTAPALLVRPATTEDMPFILATWVRSYAFGKRGGAASVFRRSYVEPILRTSPKLVVLCSPGNERVLHGHACATRTGLAWVYVAHDLWGLGYGRQLITAALGKYPDTIEVHHAWPHPSKRFQFRKFERKAA